MGNKLTLAFFLTFLLAWFGLGLAEDLVHFSLDKRDKPDHYLATCTAKFPAPTNFSEYSVGLYQRLVSGMEVKYSEYIVWHNYHPPPGYEPVGWMEHSYTYCVPTRGTHHTFSTFDMDVLLRGDGRTLRDCSTGTYYCKFDFFNKTVFKSNEVHFEHASHCKSN